MRLRPGIFVWLIWALPGMAQDALPFSSRDFDVSALTQTLPDKTLKTLRDRPERFIEAATELILGYGGADGIAPEGIENAIRVQRAHVRSREIRRMLLADLDNDGMVSRQEVDILIPTESVGRRARLLLAHRAADKDRDGQVSWLELRVHADALAMKNLPRDQAVNMRALMLLDHDGDGRVQIDEVILTVRAMRKDV